MVATDRTSHYTRSIHSADKMPLRPDGLAGRTTHHTFAHEGATREFWLHVPCCARLSRPLVLMMHGWGETGAEYSGFESAAWWRAGQDRWAEEAERGCFIVAWPQGVSTQLGSYQRMSSWNAGGCSEVGDEACNTQEVVQNFKAPLCSRDSCAGICGSCSWCACSDDVGFIVSLTRALIASNIGVDSRRVYAAGCSNGGMMTYELMMRAPAGLFAAFAANCGLPHVGHLCAPPVVRPLIHIHAGNDHTIPIDGSPSNGGGWLYTPVEEALTGLSHAGGCAAVSGPAEPWVAIRDAADPAPPNSTRDPTSLSWLRPLSLASNRSLDDETRRQDKCALRATCADGGEIVYCTGDFGHDWPAWAAAVAWNFLRQYSLDDPSSGTSGAVDSASTGSGARLWQCAAYHERIDAGEIDPQAGPTSSPSPPVHDPSACSIHLPFGNRSTAHPGDNPHGTTAPLSGSGSGGLEGGGVSVRGRSTLTLTMVVIALPTLLVAILLCLQLRRPLSHAASARRHASANRRGAGDVELSTISAATSSTSAGGTSGGASEMNAGKARAASVGRSPADDFNELNDAAKAARAADAARAAKNAAQESNRPPPSSSEDA